MSPRMAPGAGWPLALIALGVGLGMYCGVGCDRARNAGSSSHGTGQEDGIRFRPPVGQASAHFPGTPDEMPHPPIPAGTRLFSYPRGDFGAFQLGVQTERTAQPDDHSRSLLESLRDSTLRVPGSRLVRSTWRTVEDREAIEFTIWTGRPDVYIRYLIVRHGGYIYTLNSTGSEAIVSDTASDEFLNSLRFGP